MKNQPWDMARIASRRALSKPRKFMAPVGPASLLRPADGMNWTDAARSSGADLNKLQLGTAHKCCGYHVCSCKPEPAASLPVPVDVVSQHSFGIEEAKQLLLRGNTVRLNGWEFFLNATCTAVFEKRVRDGYTRVSGFPWPLSSKNRDEWRFELVDVDSR